MDHLARLETLVEAAATAALVSGRAYDETPTDQAKLALDWSKMLAEQLKILVRQMRQGATDGTQAGHEAGAPH